MTDGHPQSVTWKSGTQQDQGRNMSRKAAYASNLSTVLYLSTAFALL